VTISTFYNEVFSVVDNFVVSNLRCGNLFTVKIYHKRKRGLSKMLLKILLRYDIITCVKNV